MTVIVKTLYDFTAEVKKLNQHTFSAFGTVIENPQPALLPSAKVLRLPKNSLTANQGTALKYLDVTHMLDLYSTAPSKVKSKAVMNMFVCAPRMLRQTQRDDLQGVFPVGILERHAFTTQTFIPLGLSARDLDRNCYLVVVAPSLPSSHEDQALPVPTQTPIASSLPGRGLPDIAKLEAFIARGSQAVTYGAGTWHAPMVVLGTKPVDFVVVQFANGVEIEDCQEAVMQYQGREGIQIAIPKLMAELLHGSIKL